jgi:hydrogenase-1 operon protein HyaE
VLATDTFDAWARQPGLAMLVFAEEPERYKETLDLAVIVPELHAASGRAFRVGLLPPLARALAPRYGFARWPAFVMLRDGQYLGAVDGIRDWDVYTDRTAAPAGGRAQPPARRWASRCGWPARRPEPHCH